VLPNWHFWSQICCFYLDLLQVYCIRLWRPLAAKRCKLRPHVTTFLKTSQSCLSPGIGRFNVGSHVIELSSVKAEGVKKNVKNCNSSFETKLANKHYTVRMNKMWRCQTSLFQWSMIRLHWTIDKSVIFAPTSSLVWRACKESLIELYIYK